MDQKVNVADGRFVQAWREFIDKIEGFRCESSKTVDRQRDRHTVCLVPIRGKRLEVASLGHFEVLLRFVYIL